MSSDLKQQVRALLSDEKGTIIKDAPERVALLYPSPYRAGMSSLGYQAMYREINAAPARVAERAFLPDDVAAYEKSRTPLFTFESERPVGDHAVVAISVAYEIELAGMIKALELAGIPPLAEDRDERHPFILAGGPLTFSNPVPLAPYVDAVLLGEADETIHTALDVIFSSPTHAEALAALEKELDCAWIPSVHGETLPQLGKSSRIPAYAQIITPNTELRDMFLVEGERGCSRGCQYCVMRRSTNGGMRIVPIEEVLALIPEHARRVGLVGAAISDHPKITDLVNTLADQGREVGLSSLRPDKLKDEFVAALRRAGHKTLTTAMDGASQRMRDLVDRKAKQKHLIRAAEHVRNHGFNRLKLYMIIGLPGETDEDVDELIEFSTELSKNRSPVAGHRAFRLQASHPPRQSALRGHQGRGEAPVAAAPRGEGPRRHPRHQRALGVDRIRPRAGRHRRRAGCPRRRPRRRSIPRLEERLRRPARAAREQGRPAGRRLKRAQPQLGQLLDEQGLQSVLHTHPGKQYCHM